MRDPFPPAAKADYLISDVRTTIDYTLDDRVQTRNVAAAGEDADAFDALAWRSMKGLLVIAGIVIVMMTFAGFFAMYVMRLAGNR